jgi:hypothetical protein
LRHLGRQMWQQLERGQVHALSALEQIEMLTGQSMPPGAGLACAYIPEDLDPIELQA